MPCTLIRVGDATAIVCTSRRWPKPCHYCTKHHEVLCDHKAPGRRKTCDRPLCRDHAHHVEPDSDFCPEHAPTETAAPAEPSAELQQLGFFEDRRG